MYRRMLVPLDGSELAETVCTYAKELAGRLDIDLVLLHVANPVSGDFTPMQIAYIEHIAEIVRHQVTEVQKNTADGTPKRAKVTGEMVVGYPADEIIRYAETNSIDIILLASHGRSGLKRWTIGSVAGKVMSATKTPVWLVRTGTPEETPYDKWPKRTLIAPLDGSELAEMVLPHVEALVKQRGREPMDVVLIRVAEPLTIPTYYSPDISGVTLDWTGITQQELSRRKKAAEEYLAEIENRLKVKEITARSVVIEGKPNDEIVDFANKQPYSMVIVATHGRSGLSRLVYGSIAANILHGVSRPIFMIKPQ